MSRYITTRQIKDSNGKRKASTTIISAPPVSDKDIYIQITTPERLDLLANKFYQDASLWWIIATSNGLGKGTLFTPEDVRLRIPPKEGIQDFIALVNQER